MRPRLAVYITRIQPFTPEQLTDLHDYLCSIPRPPNRYRKVGENLTDAQRRGRKIFARGAKTMGCPSRLRIAASPAIRRRYTWTARSRSRHQVPS